MDSRQLGEIENVLQHLGRIAMQKRTPISYTSDLRKILEVAGEKATPAMMLIRFDQLMGQNCGYAYSVNPETRHPLLMQFRGPRSMEGIHMREDYDLFVFTTNPFSYRGHYSTILDYGKPIRDGVTLVDEIINVQGSDPIRPLISVLNAARS